MTELNAESTASVEAPEVDSNGAATEGAGSAPAGSEAPASGDDTSSWTEKAQKRYDELTRDRYEAAARADREAYRREQLEREVAELKSAAAKPETVAPSNDYPTLESVGHDFDEHAKAVAAWAERRATAATQAALKADRESTESQRAAQTWQQAQAEFIKSTPDYVTKVQNAPRLPISQEAQERIGRLPDGPRIAYALVENAEKALAIMHLPIDVQMLEIGRIAGRTESKPAPVVVSKAPPPVGRIEGGEAATAVKVDSPDSDNLSDAEWTRRRNAQEARRRAGK